MNAPQKAVASALTPKLAAPQHRPRPLPLFLEMLRSTTAQNPKGFARALAGLRRYQEAERTRPPPIMSAIAEVRGASLRDYAGSKVAPGPPVIFIPSLINPPNILDLAEDKSLLRWLAGRGHRVLLVDWGWDLDMRRELSVSGHVEEILVPLLAGLGEPAALVGYCLGGTMAVAAAVLAPAAALATIAAPWHFSGFPEESRRMLASLWAAAEPASASFGVLPMEVLQSAFWSLDPQRTVAKFEAFADMAPGSPQAEAFVTLEDWANDGPPVAEAAAREMFQDLFGADRPGTGQWIVGGQPIDPANLGCSSLHIVSTSDRIVPLASSIRSGKRLELASGHVGMVIGARARETLWEPLGAFLIESGKA